MLVIRSSKEWWQYRLLQKCFPWCFIEEDEMAMFIPNGSWLGFST